LSIFNQRERDFEFRPGPVFANVVLVDEINRAMPKTQSALLEAMAEQQVTVDGATRLRATPFLVMATQNPTEYAARSPLPRAQVRDPAGRREADRTSAHAPPALPAQLPGGDPRPRLGRGRPRRPGPLSRARAEAWLRHRPRRPLVGGVA